MFLTDLIKNEEPANCRAIAKELLSKHDVVGIVGAFSSACSAATQQQIAAAG